MITNLSELLAKAKVDPTKLVKRSVEWKHLDDEGNEVADIFDVHIVVDISFAAQERIYLGDDLSDVDTGRMARAISERLRFGEDGKEKMTHEQASMIHPTLGIALTKAINDYSDEIIKARKKADENESAKE